jgi:lipopolysaccharide export system protein LptA
VIRIPLRPARPPLLAGLALAGLLSAAAGAQEALRHDGSLPIEITADTLEVQQRDQVATFTGNVDAVQGDLTLSADQLRVYYRGGETAGGAGAIRRIEAAGNVFLSSPRETAQGEVGVYDVGQQLVTLERSVVLTRGANVIRGDRLEYDLASGYSRVESAVPAVAGGEPRERVRAIFTPEQGAAPGAGPTATE